MIEEKKKFYVTTPIYYVTARPHLGSLYSTVLADAAARWYKLKNYKTFVLTGTDEHGQKIAEAAAKAHKSPKEFVDSFIDAYKDMWHKYHIAYDHFMRTTDEYHVKAVQDWIRQLQDSGDIYKSFYAGFYCVPCERFVTEKADENEEAPLCDVCRRETKHLSEESYFFRLSAYQEKLLRFYEHNPDFITPSERLNEVISFVKSGLKDLSISRTTVTWGIPFPGDPKHVVYVWADALNNYITGVGYGNESRKEEFNSWWPADMQVMGKDIVRFHAVYWPAFLMASELALPKRLLVHGWLKVNSQKMSKSFGNVIDPQELLNAYGAEQVRYYLLRYMAITHDSEFSTGDLENRINTDLANDLGNLLNRMVVLAHKREIFEIRSPQNWGSPELALRDSFWSMLEVFQNEIEDGYFYKALSELWKFIHQVNAYFHAQEPWKVEDCSRFEEIISATAHSLHAIALLLWPIMPEKMEELLTSLGTSLELKIDHINELSSNPWTKTFMLNKINTLFQKYMPQEPVQSASEQKPSENKEQPVEVIDIKDFAKVMLLVGTIEHCEEVAGSDKLLKLQVNFGPYGMRQILSGVKKWFSPQDLIDKQGVFVYNLAPRKMMGLESQGMMLTAEDEHHNLTRVTVENKVPNGTQLR